MTHETTLHFTRKIVCRSVFLFWRRSAGIGLPVVIAAEIALLGLLVAQGDRSWFVGLVAGIVIMSTTICAIVFLAHYRNSMKVYQKMRNPTATLRVEDDTFTLSSSIGTTTLHWTAVKELWKFQSSWLLLFSKAQFSTLPIDDLSSEMRAFILERIQAAGGKVVG